MYLACMECRILCIPVYLMFSVVLVLCLGDLTAQGFKKKALKLELKILDCDLQEGKVTNLYSNN